MHKQSWLVVRTCIIYPKEAISVFSELSLLGVEGRFVRVLFHWVIFEKVLEVCGIEGDRWYQEDGGCFAPRFCKGYAR